MNDKTILNKEDRALVMQALMQSNTLVESLPITEAIKDAEKAINKMHHYPQTAVARFAKAEAEYDGRDWAGMPRHDQARYIDRMDFILTTIAMYTAEMARDAVRGFK